MVKRPGRTSRKKASNVQLMQSPHSCAGCFLLFRGKEAFFDGAGSDGREARGVWALAWAFCFAFAFPGGLGERSVCVREREREGERD